MSKITQSLGLPDDANEDQVVGTIEHLIETVEKLRSDASKPVAETPTAAKEKRIKAKIAESGGALNREQAILAIEHQDAQDLKTKTAKK